jgi:transposase
MTMVAELADAVVGVDTHRDAHQAEIAQPSGAPIATISVRNTEAGYAELLTWAGEHAPGERIMFLVEGTGSYGAALTRAVIHAGFAVFECAPPERKRRRRSGKSDPIDAHRAVTSALEGPVEKLSVPRANGDREALADPAHRPRGAHQQRHCADQPAPSPAPRRR